MLLLERFSEYDKLAKELTKVGFNWYKEELTTVLPNARKQSNISNLIEYTFPKLGIRQSKEWTASIPHLQKSAIVFNWKLLRKDSPNLDIDHAFSASYVEDPFVAKVSKNKNSADIKVTVYCYNTRVEFIEPGFDWNSFYQQLLRLIRHELEHQAQHLRRYGQRLHYYDEKENTEQRHRVFSISGFDTANERTVFYFSKIVSEVEAELKSVWFMSKKAKKPFKDVVKSHLKSFSFLSDDDRNQILKNWEEYRKRYFPYMPSLE